MPNFNHASTEYHLYLNLLKFTDPDGLVQRAVRALGARGPGARSLRAGYLLILHPASASLGLRSCDLGPAPEPSWNLPPLNSRHLLSSTVSESDLTKLYVTDAVRPLVPIVPDGTCVLYAGAKPALPGRFIFCKPNGALVRPDHGRALLMALRNPSQEARSTTPTSSTQGSMLVHRATLARDAWNVRQDTARHAPYAYPCDAPLAACSMERVACRIQRPGRQAQTTWRHAAFSL